MSVHPLLSHQRQVHLDFHTSPLITDLGVEFDAREFARTLKQAHVNSVTVFAKCHHGQCYYPTRTGVRHPALGGRDLLGEQIEALHREGIRAPIYTTVAWEEEVARAHPAWRQIRRDGVFAQVGRPDPSSPPGQTAWWFNNFLHPEYQDYIEEHVRELFAAYDVDGVFFDIVFFEGRSCWSDASRAFRARHGLGGDDAATQARFESLAQASFASRFTRLVGGLDPTATVFYNSVNPICGDSTCGVRSRHAEQSHWELESLPSGFWGYHHFPRLARAFGSWGKPWLGMTGRFQKMWGDFGGLKPQAALEYECFRSQALGGANSVGDQLPPRGRLDAGAYDLIGAVYAQTAAAEPFYAGSQALPEVGIIAPGAPGLDSAATDRALEGAVQICDEAHYDSVVLDDAGDFTGLRLLILPDLVAVSPALERKLAEHRRAGGAILFSQQSAFRPDGSCLLPEVPLTRRGLVDAFPTYWRTSPAFHPALSRSDRVIYLPGAEILPGPGVEILTQRVLPYFRRTELTASSHFQIPPRAEADTHPAVMAGGNWVCFADPVFSEYRQSGNIAARDGVLAAMRRLIGPARFGDGLPTTVLSVPRRRGADLLVTLLHYIPVRKALEIDMIEERSSFAGETLRLPGDPAVVRLHGGGDPLPRLSPGVFALPAVKGRLLLEVPDFFAASA